MSKGGWSTMKVEMVLEEKEEKGPMPNLSKNIYLCTQEPNCNKQIYEGANQVLQDIIHKYGHIF